MVKPGQKVILQENTLSVGICSNKEKEMNQKRSKSLRIKEEGSTTVRSLIVEKNVCPRFLISIRIWKETDN